MTAEGKETLYVLAERYPQLYLDPDAPGAEEACVDSITKGIAPEKNDLPCFHGDARDTLEAVNTPAGPVEILTLHDRADFELFLRIIAYRCRPVTIPATQGASTLDGIVNWPKIMAHKVSFLLEAEASGRNDADWGAEFKRFTSDKRNFKDTLIVLAHWPYSNVAAEDVGLSEEEWLEKSRLIRMYHELTHVICRRLYPEQINAVWDELAADAIGIYAAYGHCDRALEERFLGIEDGKYTFGRLQNYVKDPVNEGPSADVDPETAKASRQDALNALASKCSKVLAAYEDLFAQAGAGSSPFDMINVLEAQQHALWDR